MHTSSPPPAVPRRHFGYVIVTALLALSTGFGIMAYRNYDRSEKHLIGALEDFSRKGAGLDAIQCVDEVLNWAPHCDAMKDLCDASVPRLMDRCLKARGRAEDCSAWAAKSEDPKFVFSACRERGVAKYMKKTCGNAYKAIGQYCRVHNKHQG